MNSARMLSAMRREVGDILRKEAEAKHASAASTLVSAGQEAAGRGAAGRLGNLLAKGSGRVKAVGEHLARNDHAYDLGGLGVLGAVTGAEMAHAAKKDPTTGQRDLHGLATGAGELAGLGILAAPTAATMLLHKAQPIAKTLIHH